MFLLVLIILVLLAALIYSYVTTMSVDHDTFKKAGIPGPEPTPLFGNFMMGAKLGIFDVQTTLYNQYKGHKAYGWLDFGTPCLVVRDLDMVKDILSKKFNCFVNRRNAIPFSSPMDKTLLSLEDDHWKHVRNILSPMFTSRRVKNMSPFVQRNAKILLENIKEKQEAGEDVDLKELLSSFMLDAIASSGFGIEMNSLKQPENQFAQQAKKLMDISYFLFFVQYFSKPLVSLLQMCGMHVHKQQSVEFFCKTVDAAKEIRLREKREGKAMDFLDGLIDAENAAQERDMSPGEVQERMDTSVTRKGLSDEEIHASALTFIFGTYDSGSRLLSFTFFLLANHPDSLEKAQAEIDRELNGDFPDYENVQKLHFLEMCINESCRMFPPGMMIERVCSESTDVQGIHVEKGRVVYIPVYAIHNDEDIWDEPHRFAPDRFTGPRKAARHQCAFLPFGIGPRNCVGMRLGLLMLKVAIASVLQNFTPVKCDKTVYPVKLHKMALRALDGLWVKFNAR